MAVETEEDLEAMFHPDDWGQELVAYVGLTAVPFNGIFTDAPVSSRPDTSTADIPVRVPRVIAPRAPLAALSQGDRIERPDGTLLGVVNDIQGKGSIVIVVLMDEAW